MKSLYTIMTSSYFIENLKKLNLVEYIYNLTDDRCYYGHI